MSTSAGYTPPVDQPPPAVVGSPYGGFWVRFAAYFVDSFIIGIGLFLISIVGTIVAAIVGSGGVQVGLIVLMVAIGPLYHAWFVSSAKMATPGKRLCGLYVTDLEGRRLGFGRALWRNVAALFSYLTLYIGFIMAAFTERKQALHDKIAGTLVHRQPGGSAGLVIGLVVVGFIIIAVIGVLAAIAIPAHQDFQTRSKTAAIVAAMSAMKTPISEHAMNKDAWPASWEELGVPEPMSQLGAREREMAQSIRLGKEGEVVASLTIGNVAGEIRLTPKRAGNEVQWTCTASQEIWKYITATCRN